MKAFVRRYEAKIAVRTIATRSDSLEHGDAFSPSALAQSLQSMVRLHDLSGSLAAAMLRGHRRMGPLMTKEPGLASLEPRPNPA